jgi:hypothetical protein
VFLKKSFGDRKMNGDYEYDVQYEVWRMGGNPNGVDSERVEDYYGEGLYSDEAAQREKRNLLNYITRHKQRQ